MLSDLFILLIYLGVSEIIAYFLFVIANYGISSAIFQRFRLPVSELKKMMRLSAYLLMFLNVVTLIFVVIGVTFNLIE
ncbi:TPA: hypothetical protein IXG79_001594 [Enterococcus faecium]|nr:hypothetical protein [Enterococcus faecium]